MHTRFMGLRESTCVFPCFQRSFKEPLQKKTQETMVTMVPVSFHSSPPTPQPSNLAADPLKSPKGLQSLQWQNPGLARSGEASMERPVFYVKTGTAWM